MIGRQFRQIFIFFILATIFILPVLVAGPHYWPLQIADMAFPHLELALTPEAQRQGLMQRREIADDGGMLFLFKIAKIQTFWMKNTLLPLDIIFLDQEGTIVAMHSMPVEAARGTGESEEIYEKRLTVYSSKVPANIAIELKYGSVAFLGLQPGDKINVAWSELQQLQR